MTPISAPFSAQSGVDERAYEAFAGEGEAVEAEEAAADGEVGEEGDERRDVVLDGRAQA